MRPGEQRFRNVCPGHLKNYPVTKGNAVATEDIFGRKQLHWYQMKYHSMLIIQADNPLIFK